MFTPQLTLTGANFGLGATTESFEVDPADGGGVWRYDRYDGNIVFIPADQSPTINAFHTRGEITSFQQSERAEQAWTLICGYAGVGDND
jgi:hypothetical protein